MRQQHRLAWALPACALFLGGLGSAATSAPPRDGEATKHIVVRLDKVTLKDCGDGEEGEIQYLLMASTGNRGKAPIATQQVAFPLENWYEGEEDGVNATFLGGEHQAIPFFAYPETKMGDELALIISVMDDDESSDWLIDGHAVLGKIGTEVAGFFTGPAGRQAVDNLSSAVQREIVRGGKRDHLGTLSVALKRTADDGSTFGLPRGEHSKSFEREAGKVSIKYTVLRVADRAEQRDWGVRVRLKHIKVLNDSDTFTQGAGDVYVRARVADGFAIGETSGDANASQYNQKITRLPTKGGTKDVDSGEHFLRREVELYSNQRGSGRDAKLSGLPVFLYVEVGAFEDDNQAGNSGRSGDDVLGVLPLMFTARWLREHPGSNEITQEARGGSGKVRITIIVEVWDPSADPDGPVSG